MGATGLSLMSPIDIVVAFIAASCGVVILAAIILHVVARCGQALRGWLG
jgi:hypothetical protein